MKILALEFSSDQRSVAVAEADQLLGSAAEHSPRGSTGMVLVDQVVRNARLSPSEIDLIAIGLGPGSYTGIRSAIAIGQSWQLARDTRLLGISSVDLLAGEAQQREIFGVITIIIDAQRNELYAARFDISESEIRLATSLSLVSTSALDRTGKIVGPSASRLIPGAMDLYPTAATLARIAATRSDYLPGEKLEPIYLRQTTFVKAQAPRF